MTFNKETLRILGAALIFSLTLAASTQAHAQNADINEPGDPFNEGHSPTAPNQDSDGVPGLSIGSPVYGGNGCPQGTVSAVVSPDQRVLSVLFDSHVVEVGGQTGKRRERTTCTVKIPFQVPQGYRVQIVKLDYRGFVSVPKGAQAVVGGGFGYSGVRGKKLNINPRKYKTKFKGPVEQEFILSTLITGPEWTPCGESFALETEAILNMKANQNAETAISTIDSMDAEQNPVRVSMRWKRCDPNENPGRPERPDQPRRPDRPQRHSRN